MPVRPLGCPAPAAILVSPTIPVGCAPHRLRSLAAMELFALSPYHLARAPHPSVCCPGLSLWTGPAPCLVETLLRQTGESIFLTSYAARHIGVGQIGWTGSRLQRRSLAGHGALAPLAMITDLDHAADPATLMRILQQTLLACDVPGIDATSPGAGMAEYGACRPWAGSLLLQLRQASVVPPALRPVDAEELAAVRKGAGHEDCLLHGHRPRRICGPGLCAAARFGHRRHPSSAGPAAARTLRRRDRPLPWLDPPPERTAALCMPEGGRALRPGQTARMKPWRPATCLAIPSF